MTGISNTMQVEETLAPATIFAERYVLQEMMPGGDRFTVWRALDQRNGDEVALKFFPHELISEMREVSPLREILTPFRNLRDVRVVAAHQVVVEAGRCAVVTPWIKAPTLTKLRLARPNQCFDAAEVEPWIRGLIDLLEAVHARGLFHGALHPDSIHVRAGAGLSVVGFGIHAWLHFTSNAAFGQPADSPRTTYFSPALRRGDPPRATDDVFAFGALVYELLAGAPPREPGRWLKRRPLPMATQRRKGGRNGGPIPAMWETIVQACLEQDATRRVPVFRKVRIGLGVNQLGPIVLEGSTAEEPDDDATEPAMRGPPPAQAEPAQDRRTTTSIVKSVAPPAEVPAPPARVIEAAAPNAPSSATPRDAVNPTAAPPAAEPEPGVVLASPESTSNPAPPPSPEAETKPALPKAISDASVPSVRPTMPLPSTIEPVAGYPATAAAVDGPPIAIIPSDTVPRDAALPIVPPAIVTPEQVEQAATTEKMAPPRPPPAIKPRIEPPLPVSTPVAVEAAPPPTAAALPAELHAPAVERPTEPSPEILTPLAVEAAPARPTSPPAVAAPPAESESYPPAVRASETPIAIVPSDTESRDVAPPAVPPVAAAPASTLPPLQTKAGPEGSPGRVAPRLDTGETSARPPNQPPVDVRPSTATSSREMSASETAGRVDPINPESRDVAPPIIPPTNVAMRSAAQGSVAENTLPAPPRHKAEPGSSPPSDSVAAGSADISSRESAPPHPVAPPAADSSEFAATASAAPIEAKPPRPAPPPAARPAPPANESTIVPPADSSQRSEVIPPPAVRTEKPVPQSVTQPKIEPIPSAIPARAPVGDGQESSRVLPDRPPAITRSAQRPTAPPIETVPLLPPRPPLRYEPGQAEQAVARPAVASDTSPRGSSWSTYVLGALLVCTVLMTIAVGGMLGWRMFEAYQEFVDLERQVQVFPLDATEAERAIFEARLNAARTRLNKQQWRTLREAWTERSSIRPERQTTPAPQATTP